MSCEALPHLVISKGIGNNKPVHWGIAINVREKPGECCLWNLSKENMSTNRAWSMLSNFVGDSNQVGTVKWPTYLGNWRRLMPRKNAFYEIKIKWS